TNAFGMGINTSDVYLLIHFNFPLSLGQYIQESGKAGRDEKMQERMKPHKEEFILDKSTDAATSSCSNCNNCQRKAADNPDSINVTTDAIKIIEITRKLFEELEDNDIVRDDIIGIFLQLKNKKIINRKLNKLKNL
ncbi:12818_t:CDS:2, partial [Entrophospora sp. SA101]